jgi:hypothetical protein
VQDQGSQKTHAVALAADGSFHADNLEPGRYQVQAMRGALMTTLQGGGARADKPPDVGKLMKAVSENTVSAHCVVRAGETTDVTLDASDLGAGTRLVLRVLVGGRPLEDGMVEATMLDDGRVRIGMVQRGEVSVPGLCAGRVRVQLRGGLAMTPIGATQDLEIPARTDEHRATIDLPGGELRGRVIDMQSGNPLPAALVRLLSADARGDAPAMAITDGAGAFAFRALAPGTYSLVAADDLLRSGDAGNASRIDGLRVSAGESTTGIELRARPAAGLTVAVTDDAGAPVAGAMLLAVDADGRPLGGLSIAIARHDGRATLAGLPGGALRVVGRAPGLAPDATGVIELQPAEHRDAELRLRRGTRVCVDAVGRDGRALRGADVSARCNGGPWFPALLLLEGHGDGGRLELGQLAPGVWEFRITHPAAGTFTVRRAIPEGGTVTVLATPP